MSVGCVHYLGTPGASCCANPAGLPTNPLDGCIHWVNTGPFRTKDCSVPTWSGRMGAELYSCGGTTDSNYIAWTAAPCGGVTPTPTPVMTAQALPRATARPVPLPVRPCRFRSEEPVRPGEAAAAGLSPLRAWHVCEKAGFERGGDLVSACRSCGIPSERRCGPECGGYEATDPAEQ